MREEIVRFNEDILPAVYASSMFGIHGNGKKNIRKTLSFLAATDVHGGTERLEDAIYFLNEIDSLDFGIHLGDMQPGNFTQNDGSWYVNSVLASKKPFYSVMGNHDGGNSKLASLCGTREEVFDKFVRPLKGNMGLPDLDKTYYSVNFDKYKVTLIVIDNYIQPDDRDENGDFVYHTGVETISPEQLDWFIKTLNEIPEGYHMLIARHGFTEANTAKVCAWTQPRKDVVWVEHLGYGDQDILTAVVDAWVKGKALKTEIHPTDEFPNLPVLKIDVDYSKRGEGAFIGYFTGHTHYDFIGASKTYPYQNVFVFASSSSDTYQNYNSDLPRVSGTKQQDCLTVCSIDTENRLVKFVRVGSNFTIDFTERKYFTIKY